MATKRVTRTTPLRPVDSAADTVPLAAIEITWYLNRHFIGEQDPHAVKITGTHLGQVLAWLVQTRPGVMRPKAETSDDEIWTRGEVGFDL